MWDYLVWGILFFVLLVTEFLTVAFVSIWFALASLIAFILALCNVPMEIQLVVFVGVSTILLLGTRPLVKRCLTSKKVSTNADSVIGMEGIVKLSVDNLKQEGRVYVNGLDWAAKSSTGDLIKADERIVVEKIQGVTLWVKKA